MDTTVLEQNRPAEQPAVNPLAPGFELGIDEELVRQLVDAFYSKVRADPSLAPIFDAAIAPERWPVHLAKMYDFWSSIALMSGRYKGKPVQVHAALPAVDDRHFRQWLHLFQQTAREVCPPQAAAFFIDRALRIAQSLRLGIAFERREDTTSITPVETLLQS